MKALEISIAAADLIGGDRKQAYGNPEDGMTRVAILWNGWLHATGAAGPRALTGADVAKLMVLFKLARSVTGPLRMDNFIDMAGWAAVAGEAAASEAS